MPEPLGSRRVSSPLPWRSPISGLPNQVIGTDISSVLRSTLHQFTKPAFAQRICFTKRAASEAGMHDRGPRWHPLVILIWFLDTVFFLILKKIKAVRRGDFSAFFSCEPLESGSDVLESFLAYFWCRQVQVYSSKKWVNSSQFWDSYPPFGIFSSLNDWWCESKRCDF